MVCKCRGVLIRWPDQSINNFIQTKYKVYQFFSFWGWGLPKRDHTCIHPLTYVGPTICEKNTMKTCPNKKWRRIDCTSPSSRLVLQSNLRGTCQVTSLIRIHLRRTLDRACLPLQSNSRCALRACMANLIASWHQCDTNRRRAKGHMSPIMYKSETRRKRMRHQFG
jgi:hypothetical protein